MGEINFPSSEYEMPSIVSLVRMELNGVGFSASESERQKKILTARMDELESEAFRLVGHPFQMTSPEDISQVRRSRKDIETATLCPE